MANAARNNQNDQEYVPIQDFKQYTLFAPDPGKPGWRASMTFAIRDGAPRVTVWAQNGETRGNASAGFDPITFERVLAEMEAFLRSNPEKGQQRFVENMARPKSLDPKKMPKPEELIKRNRLIWGTDNEGLYWLGIQQENFPQIAFRLVPSMWHRFSTPNGQTLTPQEESRLQMMHLITSLRRAITTHVGKLKEPYVGDSKSYQAPVTGRDSIGDPIDDIPL